MAHQSDPRRPRDPATLQRRCPICERRTRRLGLYQLRGGRLHKLSGVGPDDIATDAVIDSEGLLAERSRE